MRYLILFFISFLPLFSQVNTEELRKYGLEEGLYHKVDFGLGLVKGNSDLVKVSGSYRIDYIKEKYNIFYVMNYEFHESDGNKVVNKGFAHLRGIHNLHNKLKAEAFIQKEFNEFILLKDRYLVGSVLRYNVVNFKDDEKDFLKFFVGSGFMYEFEYYNIEKNNTSNLIRSTSYLTVDWNMNDIVKFSTITYLQFVLDNFSDRRILNESSVNFKISDNLKFYTKVNYRLDSEPPPDIKKYDLEIKNGFTITF